MPAMKRVRGLIKSLLFGDSLLSQEFTVGLPDPQTETSVWLHGDGTPVDVTCSHSTACADPFTIAIVFEENILPQNRERLSLKFCENGGNKKVLGEIGLQGTGSIPVPGAEILLFEPRSSVNHCLPRRQLALHYLLDARNAKNAPKASEMNPTFLERRAAMVTFIRPHPVVLVSLGDEASGNMFPMNVMGRLGDRRFGLALRNARRPAHLLEQWRRVAVSSVPLASSAQAYALASNHSKQSIAWDELPFALSHSTVYGIPVPAFAQRVREMEVESSRRIGSHIFFVMRILSDEQLSDEPVVSVIHGFFQAWRMRGRNAELKASVADDWRNRHDRKTGM